MALLIALLFWSFDRIEPPWAVLVGDDGRVVEVPVERLPPDARPGDRLQTLAGPVVGDREARRARIAARLGRLAGLASTSPVGHRSAVNRRRPDHFARRAQREGFAARSVYKLEEIDRRVGLLRRGMRVLDLGCSPGSWLQYAAAAVGPRGRVVGIDLKPVEVAGGAHVRAEVADAFETPPAQLLDWGGGPFDLVLSDMAPATSGNRLADHARSIDLCRRALTVAEAVLASGGGFVCKVFEGEDAADLAADVRSRFERFKRIKPKGTRSESVELFFVAQGYRAGQGT